MVSKSLKVLTLRVQLLLKAVLKRSLRFSGMFCIALVIFHFCDLRDLMWHFLISQLDWISLGELPLVLYIDFNSNFSNG